MTVEVLTKDIDTTSNRMRLVVKEKSDGSNIYSPYFYLDTVEYNETATRATMVGYDLIGRSNQYTIGEVNITFPITLENYARAVVQHLGGVLEADFVFNPTLEEGTVNVDGSETLHDMLNAIAEVTGTVCYCSRDNYITFKALSADIVDEFGPEFYFEFKTQEPIQLTQLICATELGENYVTGEEGRAQILWENPFLNLREDAPEWLDSIFALVNGLTMVPYTLRSRGNPCYELGDRIAVTSIDGKVSNIYFINETFTFHGGFSSNSEWINEAAENPHANPTSLGKALKKATAKVDKINNEISLIVKENKEMREDVSQLIIDAEGMLAEVEGVDTRIDEIEGNVETLTKKVATSITNEEVKIQIQQELATNGAPTVKTTTGYTFNESGMTIDKENSDISTKITENGMTIYQVEEPILVANNEGVKATDLHATTYLIIGVNSRFEDYDNNTRTGCFWIGK